MFKAKTYVYTLFVAILLLVSSCGDKDLNSESELTTPPQSISSNQAASSQAVKLNKKSKPIAPRTTFRDWKEIKSSGFIIALKLDWESSATLSTLGSTSSYHTSLVERFAGNHGLKVRWLKVKSLAQMFEFLDNFQADIIPRHLTITENRLENFAFTYPLLRDKEVVISHAAHALVKNSKAPSKKTTAPFNSKDEITVSLPIGSAYFEHIRKQYPHWKIKTLSDPLTSEQLAHKVEDGEIEFTVIDGLAYDVMKSYQSDIGIVFTVPKAIQIAWATNSGNTTFLRELNEFISVQHLLEVKEPKRTTDFVKLRKSKKPLRVITRNSPETYFLWRGELLGFEYEIMNKFAKDNHVRVNYIVADTYAEMLIMLETGVGDVIAAGVSRTAERNKENAKDKLVTSVRYNRVDEMLVAHRDSKAIKTLSDLKGRTITVRETSSFWLLAQQLVKDYGVILKAADETVTTEHLIAEVAAKEVDLTISDSNLLAIEKSFRQELVTPLILNKSVPYAYVVRKNNPQLLSYLNEFTRKHYRGTFYNVVKNKYFKNESLKRKYEKERLQAGTNLSPYDSLVRLHATPYNLDWRLIVSQMYQESRFNPLASNSTGAKGLMQMMPRTAKELGVKDLKDPEQSIASGVEYLDWTRDRFSKDLPVQEQIFFSLASYNAGYGHVKDAQRLAKKMGWRDDKWFNNVEKAMLLLQKRKYYKKARYGYVRGTEPVNYVRDIHQRYLSYIRITD